jgi:hypothetical protein
MNYDESIRVTKEQYDLLRHDLSGIVATRTSGFWFWKKYYVKLWMTSYGHILKAYLKQQL